MSSMDEQLTHAAPHAALCVSTRHARRAATATSVRRDASKAGRRTVSAVCDTVSSVSAIVSEFTPLLTHSDIRVGCVSHHRLCMQQYVSPTLATPHVRPRRAHPYATALASDAACNWDNGMCGSNTQCDSDCPAGWPGDGVCDPSCNNEACDHDGGDCGPSGSTDHWCAEGCPPAWSEWRCMHERNSRFHSLNVVWSRDSRAVDDHYCDADCFNEACGWDGADCYCSEGCDPRWLNDGVCQSQCNNDLCGFDLGDCTPDAPDSDCDSSDCYDLTIIWPNGEPDIEIKALATRAANLWSAAIVEDINDMTFSSAFVADGCGLDYTFPAGSTIDDVAILSDFSDIDGPGGTLGYAGPCVTDNQGFVRLGIMVFDNADLQSMRDDGILERVLAHEIGHILGLGVRCRRVTAGVCCSCSHENA